jgi:putative restriction endonuclease
VIPSGDRRLEAVLYVSSLTNGGSIPITWKQLQNFQSGPAPPSLDRPAPYEDEMSDDGRLVYRFRGTDSDHYQNRWLRALMDQAVPLIYLFGIAPGIYDVHGAVIMAERPADLAFEVELMEIDAVAVGEMNLAVGADALSRRHYLRLVRQRAMQSQFRVRVLTAYRDQCSVCRLRHRELLDAAHIISDRSGGLMHVTNGLSLCKIHHAAFDTNILGIRPDYVAEIRSDLLEEIDGPMLRHGLQDVHGQLLNVPRRVADQPARSSLERRYEEFRSAS